MYIHTYEETLKERLRSIDLGFCILLALTCPSITWIISEVFFPLASLPFSPSPLSPIRHFTTETIPSLPLSFYHPGTSYLWVRHQMQQAMVATKKRTIKQTISTDPTQTMAMNNPESTKLSLLGDGEGDSTRKEDVRLTSSVEGPGPRLETPRTDTR